MKYTPKLRRKGNPQVPEQGGSSGPAGGRADAAEGAEGTAMAQLWQPRVGLQPADWQRGLRSAWAGSEAPANAEAQRLHLHVGWPGNCSPPAQGVSKQDEPAEEAAGRRGESQASVMNQTSLRRARVKNPNLCGAGKANGEFT